MFKFIAKSFVATFFFKRYRRAIISTIALFVSYFVISLIHDDYVSYAEAVSQESSLIWALLLKWLALVLVSIIYYLVNFPIFGKKSVVEPGSNGVNEQVSTESDLVHDFSGDPFSVIRKKKVLKSKGDIELKQ